MSTYEHASKDLRRRGKEREYEALCLVATAFEKFAAKLSEVPMGTAALDTGAHGGTETEERRYPCDRCGKMRTKAEGGTVFTVCDACWEKLPP